MSPKTIAGAALAPLLFAAACGPGEETGAPEIERTGLAAIQERGELVVLTTRGPTIYQEGLDGRARGYEVDLARAFAEDLGVEVSFIVFDDLSGVLDAIQDGEGDIAAAGITRTDRLAAVYDFAAAYKNVDENVITRRGGLEVEDVSDLAGADMAVVAQSSYVDSLEALREANPGIDWIEVEAASAMPLLAQVQAEELDATIADSNVVAHARLEYPELLAPINLAEDKPYAWITAPDSEDLIDALDIWFSRAHSDGLLEELDEKWYGHTIEEFDYVDVRRFIRRIDERLPEYREAFEEAADQYGLDWRWLAAQGYQESHWDADARSPTGVRGLMMLTLPTAGELGVKDRTDPYESIRGGAQYMANMMRRIPEGVRGQDRLFKAMAAYNVGLGHVRDARRLAEAQGLNADAWPDVRRTLPLLSEPEYYKDLPYGYARGGEPVHYVRNIRRYKALLDMHLPPDADELERSFEIEAEAEGDLPETPTYTGPFPVDDDEADADAEDENAEDGDG
ncbi:MAG: membrane-bound lytic murein transglycosylase MltF [Oceanicaulis sp.]